MRVGPEWEAALTALSKEYGIRGLGSGEGRAQALMANTQCDASNGTVRSAEPLHSGRLNSTPMQ